MADKKISELTAKTTLVAADLLVIVDTEAVPDETKQITAANLATYLASIGSYATLAGTEELDNKTLDSSVLKGTFTNSGTVTMPALTLGGNVTTTAGITMGLAGALVTFTANAPILDVGSGDLAINTTGAYKGLYITSTNDGTQGACLVLYQNSASPAANDYCGVIYMAGEDSGSNITSYGSMATKITNATHGAETANMEWWLLAASFDNLAMSITGAGTLWVDENITLDTGQYVGLDATSNVTFAANSLVANAGSGGLTVNSSSGYNVAPNLSLVSTATATAGAGLSLYQNSSSPADADNVGAILLYGNNDNATPEKILFGQISVSATDVSDGTEDGTLDVWLVDNGTANKALYLLGTGALYLDATGDGSATVTLFDKYDDALVLKETIQHQNLEKLVEIGIATRKNTGSGYMINTQSMMRLLAGGIYQSREMIDQLFEELKDTKERLAIAERKLTLIGGKK